ncbi:hypothetical protein ACFFX0_24900 [Citricoccus parietis]|uniref:Uncharacterized protein n=1 Tax=Citricoccus parietis TaxID=592307 RepID=A0ABV5G5R7_9MICC
MHGNGDLLVTGWGLNHGGPRSHTVRGILAGLGSRQQCGQGHPLQQGAPSSLLRG